MKFSYNWLKEYIKGKLPKPEKVAELLSLHSLEVEAVEKKGTDFVLDIDVLPNRAADCFSHIGIAREIAVVTKRQFQIPSLKFKEKKGDKAKDFISLGIKNRADCPRYTARVVTGLKIGPSPKWIQNRLKVLGLKPINNVVDITNLVMLETGQPLHAFDRDKIADYKIIVRRAKEREKIATLDDEKYTLDKKVLLIADSEEPLGIAGIKGGKKAEITKKTKTIVLESANFNSKVIRAGSKSINLKTDASLRFEHGIDPNLTETAANRAVALMEKFAKGEVIKGLVDFYPKKKKCKKIKLDLDYLEGLLGIKISKKEIRNILRSLEFKVADLKPREIEVEVPTFRLDVQLPENLIEEIGRISGLQEIPSVFPHTALIPPKRNFNIFWEDITKNILKEAGLSEVYTRSFIAEKEARILGYPISQLIEVENPVSLDYQYLRPSLISTLLKVVRENQKQFKDIRIFELGKTFKKKKGEGRAKKYEEKRMLTGVMTGDAFYLGKGIIDMILNRMGISDVWYDSYQPTPEQSEISLWHPKVGAEIKIGHQEIGFLGELSSTVLAKLKIKGKMVIFDIDFEKLQKLSSEEHEYVPISAFPVAIRDISLLVPREIKVVEVLNQINRAGGSLIRDVDLFDIYIGEEIPTGKKNLSFHLIYQAQDRTLGSKEIDQIQEKIIKTLEINPGWQVRSKKAK